ncbi:TPA: hypothetical protein ACOEMI_002616 [Enterobacter ludwigii]
MDESRKQFEEWWNHPEQEELRKSCAEGWGERIWIASRAAIEIELPKRMVLVGLEDIDRTLTAINAGMANVESVVRAAGIKVKE